MSAKVWGKIGNFYKFFETTIIVKLHTTFEDSITFCSSIKAGKK